MDNQPPQAQQVGWLQEDPQPTPAEYRKLMLGDLPNYRGLPHQSWSSHLRLLELAWAAYRVPPHDTVNLRNALLLSLVAMIDSANSMVGATSVQLPHYDELNPGSWI